MALGAVVWEIRTDGSDTNGGGYDSTYGGTDYSQQAAAQLTVTDAACTGDTHITSATGGFTAAMKGNTLYLSDTPATRYCIVDVVNSNDLIIDRNGPTASGMTCKIGGALESLGGLGYIWTDANTSADNQKAYIRNGTYYLETVTPNVSRGPIKISIAVSAKKLYLKGYDPIYGRDSFSGTMPEIDTNGLTAGSNTYAVCSDYSWNRAVIIAFIKVKSTSNTGTINGFYNAGPMIRCEAVSDYLMGYGFYGPCFQCRSYNWTNAFFGDDSIYVSCFAHSADARGFDRGMAFFCIGKNCYRDFYGSRVAVNCIAYGGNFGFQSSYFSDVVVNCIAYGQSSYAYGGYDAASKNLIVVNCASGGTRSGTYPPLIDENPILLTANPFVDPTNDDFRLNDVAGGGLLCKEAGINPIKSCNPLTYQDGVPDLGAVQTLWEEVAGLQRLVQKLIV